MARSISQMIPGFMKKKPAFQSIVGCSSGASALEFAFTAPVVITMVVGIMEIAMMMFISSVVEGSVRQAARFGITGAENGGISREQAIVAQVSSDTLGLIEIDGSNITMLIYPSFEDVGQPEPFQDDDPANGSYDAGEAFTDINGNGQWDQDMGLAGAGGPEDVVIYRVDYDWPLMLGLLADSFGQSLSMSASIAVRHEPYGDV